MIRIGMKVILFGVAVGAGCGAGMVDKSQDTLRAQAGPEMGCQGGDAKVVYYGLRGKDIQGSSACFGPTADKLAVVECGGQRRAYWGFGDRWEVRPGTVTAVEADHVELSVGDPGSAVETTARCGH